MCFGNVLDVGVLAFAGAGFYAPWIFGVVYGLQMRMDYDASRYRFAGSSAGAYAAALAVCGVNAHDLTRRVLQDVDVQAAFERPSGGFGDIEAILRKWLVAALPENAAQRCDGRLGVLLYKVDPHEGHCMVWNYANKGDVVDAVLASMHLPVYSNGLTISAEFRGARYVDSGAFGERNEAFVRLIPGRVLLVDHRHDDTLSRDVPWYRIGTPEIWSRRFRAGIEYANRVWEHRHHQVAP